MLTCTGDIYIICLFTSVYSRFSFSPFSSWNLFLATTTTTSITFSSISHFISSLSLFSFLLLLIYLIRLAILSSISLFLILLSLSHSLSPHHLLISHIESTLYYHDVCFCTFSSALSSSASFKRQCFSTNTTIAITTFVQQSFTYSSCNQAAFSV